MGEEALRLGTRVRLDPSLSWRVRLRSRFRSLKKDREVLCTRPESDSTRLRSDAWDPRPTELIRVGEPQRVGVEVVDCRTAVEL